MNVVNPAMSLKKAKLMADAVAPSLYGLIETRHRMVIIIAA